MAHSIYRVYKAECKATGKVYIGQETGRPRWKTHRQKSTLNDDTYFHRAIRKYGIEMFEWSIIGICTTKEELDAMEIMFIAKYKAFGSGGYNMNKGGFGGHLGRKLSEEHKRKISEANKGKVVSATTRKKLHDIGKKRQHPKEVIELLKKVNLGRKLSKEHKRKIGASSKGNKYALGHKLSEEHKKKLLNSRKGKSISDEHRRKISEANKGKVHPTVVCIHCKKVGRGGAMKRYHFDNCKMKGANNG